MAKDFESLEISQGSLMHKQFFDRILAQKHLESFLQTSILEFF